MDANEMEAHVASSLAQAIFEHAASFASFLGVGKGPTTNNSPRAI
jgi:hypothetical protein